MKTLDEIPPTWSRLLPANDGDAEGCDSSRFECVAGRQWVLDHQTGLVWQRSISFVGGGFDWAAARTCIFFHDGGWRLPSVTELGSLRAHPNAPGTGPLGLPAGHPFLIPTNNNSSIDYWTMTTSASNPFRAWFYRFSTSVVDIFPKEGLKTDRKQRLCVRDSRPGMALY